MYIRFYFHRKRVSCVPDMLVYKLESTKTGAIVSAQEVLVSVTLFFEWCHVDLMSGGRQHEWKTFLLTVECVNQQWLCCRGDRRGGLSVQPDQSWLIMSFFKSTGSEETGGGALCAHIVLAMPYLVQVILNTLWWTAVSVSTFTAVRRGPNVASGLICNMWAWHRM